MQIDPDVMFDAKKTSRYGVAIVARVGVCCGINRVMQLRLEQLFFVCSEIICTGVQLVLMHA